MMRSAEARMGFAHMQYRTARVTTASPVQLVVSLYEGAIRFMREAIERGAAGDLPGRSKAISRAHAIVSELVATLDHERAPEISAQLASLYDFCLDRMMQASVQGDAALLGPAIGVLETLKGAWSQLAARGT